MPSTRNQTGVTIVTRLYAPDVDAVGRYAEQLAESLAGGGRSVTVVCAGRSPDGARPTDGVRVIRVPLPQPAGSGKVRRLIDWIVFAWIAALVCASRRPRDLVVCTSFPPTTAFAMAALGRRTCLWCLDVYPEALALAGMTTKGSVGWKVLAAANAWAIRRMRAVVTLNETMARTVSDATGRRDVRVAELWADPRQAPAARVDRDRTRKELGLSGEFVAMYAGNLGIGHDAEALLEAIAASSRADHLRWVLVGSGEGRARIDRSAGGGSVRNLVSLPVQPVARMPSLLSAADVHLVTLCPGFDTVMFPSKLLAAVASGTPVVAVCDADSELGRLVTSERIGLVVAPGDGGALVDSLESLRRSPDALGAMRARIVELARGRFAAHLALARWDELVRSIA